MVVKWVEASLAVLVEREMSPPRLRNELTERATGGFRLGRAVLLADGDVGGEDGRGLWWQGSRCFTSHPLSHPLAPCRLAGAPEACNGPGYAQARGNTRLRK